MTAALIADCVCCGWPARVKRKLLSFEGMNGDLTVGVCLSISIRQCEA
jgi:hypothetical protein